MASSTSEPMAMAIPPRLIVLMVNPNPFSVRMAVSSDSGRATSEMRVTRPFMRKKKSTTTTNRAPSHSEWAMLSMELSIKRDCLKMSVDICTSGSVFCSSARVLSSCSVSSSVLVAGCLVTVMSTAGQPRSDATPSLGDLLPITTSATSLSTMGSPLSENLTNPLAMSLASRSATMPRTTYSLPYS